MIDFAQFWQAYPRKCGRLKALQVWNRLIHSDQKLALAGVAMWRQAEQWHQAGGKFIPYASTYLAQRRWDDEPWPGAREEFGIEVRNVLE